MRSYEATINIRHISSSPKARASMSIGAAAKNARGTLDYITRLGAGDEQDIMVHSEGVSLRAGRDEDKAALKAMTRDAIANRASKEKSDTGIRLADKLIISLPNDATKEEHRLMAEGIMRDLGGDSDAWLIGAIHRDKTGNPHLHILAIDGKETAEHAQQRNALRAAETLAQGKKPRVRRGDHLRLNEAGSRLQVRERIAAEINSVGQPAGRKFAEHRSYKDRGILKSPGEHEGPAKRAIKSKKTAKENEVWLTGRAENFIGDIDLFDNPDFREVKNENPFIVAEEKRAHQKAAIEKAIARKMQELNPPGRQNQRGRGIEM